MSRRPPPLRVFFNNFWNGFTEKTDSMDCTFFITLLEKVFESPIHISSSPDDATVLVESIFGNRSYLNHKKWRSTFLFTGETHYCNHPHVSEYDCVLGFEETHDNRYVHCPLYLLFLQTNPSILQQIRDGNTHVPTPTIPPSHHASVIISSSFHGHERMRFTQRLEEKMTVFYGGKYKNNIGGPVAGHFNSPAMIDFYRRGRFAITMENSIGPYYITEKLVNGLRAGVIPVYWGTNRVAEFFNPRRFFHLKSTATDEDMSELIERMCKLTDEEYLNMIREPIMLRSMEDVITEVSESVKKIVIPHGPAPAPAPAPARDFNVIMVPLHHH
jgi:hypothetical protein